MQEQQDQRQRTPVGALAEEHALVIRAQARAGGGRGRARARRLRLGRVLGRLVHLVLGLVRVLHAQRLIRHHACGMQDSLIIVFDPMLSVHCAL